MSLSRMANIVALGSAACTLAIASTPFGAHAAALAPPDGSYKFSVTRAGASVGSTVVTVKRVAPGVTIHELETFGGVTETVDESLDGGDLSPTGYVSTFPVTSDVPAVTARVAFYSGGARFTIDTVPGSTDFNMEEGTTRMVVVDGALATGFLFLPAQIHEEQLTRFTLFAPSGAETFYCTLNAIAMPPRPAGLPAPDVSVTVDGTAQNGNTEFVVWYDPTTLIVDEVDVPTQQVTIARVRS
ncbi:MAG TPA: hypothetical protein VEV38_14350 [Candidatus Eremiobacteraceae bacterium]|nr:hypothetical protein [Candidatus Eremiobacteraceae bacterium]